MPALDFIAVDVETANTRLSSICQLGLATYIDGHLTREESFLIDPEAEFDSFNTSIHGISARDVLGSPTFRELAPLIDERLRSAIAVCHTHFDRSAIGQSFTLLGRLPPACTWLDTARVARRAWPEKFGERGYGLKPVCEHIGYQFAHHAALEDAKAAAAVLFAACAVRACDVAGWLDFLRRKPSDSVAREGDEDGLFFGEVIAFTGALAITRREAADLAARLGCEVGDGVTRKTTILVIGDQHPSKLAGHAKSSKHRKAEALVGQGLNIRICYESDFMAMLQAGEPQ